MRNILYLCDDSADLKKFEAYMKNKVSKTPAKLFICPAIANSNLVQKVNNCLSRYGTVTNLHFIDKFHKNALLYRDSFVKFLSDFSAGRGSSRLDLRKYFIHSSGAFSLWWLSLVAEKNTLKMQSYHNLAKLITIMEFCEKYSIDKAYLDIQDGTLINAVIRNIGRDKVCAANRQTGKDIIHLPLFFIKAIGYLALFLVRKCILYFMQGKDLSRRLSILKRSKFLFVATFPYADEGLLKSRIFKNRYLGPLQSSIELRYKGKTSWIGNLEYNSRLNIPELNMAKTVNSWGYCIIMPEELVSLNKIASAFFNFLCIGAKYLKKLRYLSANFIFKLEEKSNIAFPRSVRVWDLFRDEWTYSFFGTYLIEGLVNYYLFQRIASLAEKEMTVIYPAELFAWENALNIARKENNKIKTVGIQHAFVRRLLLSYFNFSGDLKDTNAINQFPLPSHMAVSGSIARDIFIGNGWPKDRIFEMGAIRYHWLSKLMNQDVDWNSRKKQVVVCTSSIAEESHDILLMLWNAFKNRNICNFVIRPHPICPVTKIAKAIGLSFADSKFILDSDSSLENLLRSSRALIVAGSTAALEAIACGCPVIVPRLSSKAEMSPLSGLREDLAKFVADEVELFDAVKSIVYSERLPLKSDECTSFIKECFTIRDNEDGYYVCLEKELSRK